MNGKRIWIQIRKSKKGKAKYLKLRNLSSKVTKLQIERLLRENGMDSSRAKIIDFVKEDPSRAHVGRCLVEFENAKDAAQMATVLNGSKLDDREISINFVEDITCRRCGKVGHWFRKCEQARQPLPFKLRKGGLGSSQVALKKGDLIKILKQKKTVRFQSDAETDKLSSKLNDLKLQKKVKK